MSDSETGDATVTPQELAEAMRWAERQRLLKLVDIEFLHDAIGSELEWLSADTIDAAAWTVWRRITDLLGDQFAIDEEERQEAVGTIDYAGQAGTRILRDWLDETPKRCIVVVSVEAETIRAMPQLVMDFKTMQLRRRGRPGAPEAELRRLRGILDHVRATDRLQAEEAWRRQEEG